jgi:hypothetical protein
MPHPATDPRDWGPLEGAYHACLRASCEALYPPTESGAPTWQDAELVPRMSAYVRGLPPTQRRLLKLMFLGVELFSLVATPGRRFSSRPLAARIRALTRWRGSSILPLRLLGDALKSSVQMVYLTHPSVVAFIGEYKVWEHPDEAYPMPIRGTADQGEA